jgi:hypothetical protein
MGVASETTVGALDVAEMALGEIPLVGTLVHGLQAVDNESDKMAAQRAGLSDPENLEKYQEADSKETLNMIEAIPAVGSGVGLVDIGTQIYKHFEGGEDLEDCVKKSMYPPGAPATPGGPPTPSPAPTTREPGTRPWDYGYGEG